MVLASIWRMRSRVTPNFWPTSSRVCGCSPLRPKRSSMTLRSRCVQHRQHARRAPPAHGLADRLDRLDGLVVVDEVAELRVAFVADRRLEAHRLLADLEDLAHLLGRRAHLARDLFGGGLAAQVLEELALHADELVDLLDHVHRHADGARLVGDGPGDRLADPPGGVGRELVALAVVELLDGADEAEVALLDEVEERQAATDVALGDRDDETQVGLDRACAWHPCRRARCACARDTSWSAVSSGTLPISLRYLRTGSVLGVLSDRSSSRAGLCRRRRSGVVAGRARLVAFDERRCRGRGKSRKRLSIWSGESSTSCSALAMWARSGSPARGPRRPGRAPRRWLLPPPGPQRRLRACRSPSRASPYHVGWWHDAVHAAPNETGSRERSPQAKAWESGCPGLHR